jgi:transcriptional regulator with XRE-family HTH domain
MAFTHAQLAKKLGVSESTIAYWKRNGCPTDGTLAQIQRWREEWDAKDPRKLGPSTDPDLANLRKSSILEDVLERRERRQVAALKRQQLEGSLVPIDAAKRLVVKLGERAQAKALALPKARAKAFVGVAGAAEAERLLDAFVRDVLAALAGAGAD